MNKFKGLRIALVYGKGEDGCGVTRTGAEVQLWSKKVGASTHVYFYSEKKFSRSGGHEIDSIFFKGDELSKIAERLDSDYDIVMFMNYPSNKHPHDYSKSFYYDFYDKIQKPYKVFHQSDIHKGQCDKTPYLLPMLVNADIIFHYDMNTWFSKTINDYKVQQANERLQRYTLWFNFDEVESVRNKYPIDEKIKSLTSVTRWSSLKNVGRTIDIMDSLLVKTPEIKCKVYGIERSIGAKFDILDRDDTTYVNKTDDQNPTDENVAVYGPVTRNAGLDIVASHLFASSFFSLPKNPENYGNRMEYTQIEMIGVGTIPVFDKHWGENNGVSDGRKYIDIPYSAIYSDGSDTKELADKLLAIASDPEEIQKYIETSYKLVKDEFDAETVLPKAIDTIMSKGKNTDQMSVYDICEKYISTQFADGVKGLEDEGKLPVIGLGILEDPGLYYLNENKKELVKKLKKTKKGNKILF